MSHKEGDNKKSSNSSRQVNSGSNPEKHTTPFSFHDISEIRGVTPLTGKTIPPDLVRHTNRRGKQYKIRQYYQLDNIQHYRSWQQLLRRTKSKERWLFYPCPLEYAHDVLTTQSPIPYGEFFPRVFGRNAVYLFESSSQSARVALKFGVESEGILISCRVLTSKVFWAKKPYPKAVSPPRGYDVVAVKSGTDIGFGQIQGDMIVIYNPDMALMRYATYIIT